MEIQMSVELFFFMSVSVSMLGMYAIFSKKSLVVRDKKELEITWATGVTITTFLTTSMYAIYAGAYNWLFMWAFIPPFLFGIIQCMIFVNLVEPLLSATTSETKEEGDSKIVNISQRR